jgi:regulator of protease activity HflC (stomatin/prohibitin superfamily)
MYMNRGSNRSNLPKSKPGGIDGFVENLNKWFGRLLGKKDNLPPPQPQQTSNTTFSIIILLSCLLLWFCTGFYFLSENEYGLILANGKVVDVKRGIRVGFSLPYPFGNVEIIDATPIKAVAIGDTPANSFTVLDENLLPVLVGAKFSYRITNPKILYQNRLQDQDAFDTEILWQVQSKIRDAIALKSSSELKSANFTVLSNEISDKLNSILVSYGIALDKFTILSISQPSAESSGENNGTALSARMMQQPIAVQLQAQAAAYNDSEVANAVNQQKEFDALLPVYRQNAIQTITSMYNDTINKIPMKPSDNKYDLLFLSLRELRDLGSAAADKRGSSSERNFTREVVRDRSGALD